MQSGVVIKVCYPVGKKLWQESVRPGQIGEQGIVGLNRGVGKGIFVPVYSAYFLQRLQPAHDIVIAGMCHMFEFGCELYCHGIARVIIQIGGKLRHICSGKAEIDRIVQDIAVYGIFRIT